MVVIAYLMMAFIMKCFLCFLWCFCHCLRYGAAEDDSDITWYYI